MGAFLEKPKTEKTNTTGEGYGIRYAVSAMQGWRMEMEDSHVCKTDFIKNWSFFGVFDGHAGPKVSQYCSQKILDQILEKLKEKDSEEAVKTAIYEGFLALDQNIKDNPTWANGDDHSGTTAITVMISPTHIYLANCGDSRGIICSDGKLKFSTEDHKPYLPDEKSRIEKAGGTVMMQRVNGSLAVSRALGDFDYKRNNSIKATEQLVSPAPDVTVLSRDNDKDEFLLLACDGIYDVMSNEEVLSYVRHQLKLTANLDQVCNNLIDCCLNKNSRDNMSVILVVFPNAPQVSQEAIEEDKKLQKEAHEKISKKIKELVESANDPLEVEETYVMQQLMTEFPMKYDVPSKKAEICEELESLRKEKFGDVDRNFTGNSDASAAPPEFTMITQQGNIHITGIMEPSDYPKDDILLHSNENSVTEVIEDSGKEEEKMDEGVTATQESSTNDTGKDVEMMDEGVNPTKNETAEVKQEGGSY